MDPGAGRIGTDGLRLMGGEIDFLEAAVSCYDVHALPVRRHCERTNRSINRKAVENAFGRGVHDEKGNDTCTRIAVVLCAEQYRDATICAERGRDRLKLTVRG